MSTEMEAEAENGGNGNDGTDQKGEWKAILLILGAVTGAFLTGLGVVYLVLRCL